MDPLKLTPVNSGMLSAVGYDEKTKEFTVQFKNGNTVYRYQNVSKETNAAFQAAESKGKYFLAHIRDKHTGAKVEQHKSAEAS